MKDNLKIKLFFLIFAALVLVFSISELTITRPVRAGSSHNVSGWAWSENIGWISFNSSNCDANGDGFSDGVPAGCPGGAVAIPDYGVNIDESTGLFSGYAWSNNIGWISFNAADLAGCPSGLCQAKLDLATLDISGWARALGAGGEGGWDGWIKLRGVSQDLSVYGISLNTGTSPKEFQGFAWGGDDTSGESVMGWINFNCQSQSSCPSSDYKVVVNLNFGPTASNPAVDRQQYCGLPSGEGLVSFSWSYQDAEGDSQSNYNLQIATDPGFNSLVVDYTASQTVASGGTGTSGVSVVQSPTPALGDLDIGYNDQYYWRVRVKAGSGSQNWSNWAEGPQFNAPVNPYPQARFAIDVPNPIVKQNISFSNQTLFYDSVCSADPSNPSCAYTWNFGDGGAGSGALSPVYAYSAVGTYSASLASRDSSGYSCGPGSPMSITVFEFPQARWKEIVPF